MDKEEIIGKNILNIAPKELHHEISENFKKLAHKEISGVKSFSWNKNGTKIPVQIKQSIINYNLQPALLLHVRKTED